MRTLTIHQAAEATGWSQRMLRYIEDAGLVQPDRSVSGYRLYTAAHVHRLRTLKALLQRFDLTLSDIAFAERLRRDTALGPAVDAWLTAGAEPAPRAPGWLRFEQEKHQRLLVHDTLHEEPA